MWLPESKNISNICFDRMYERDRQTDRRTDEHRMTAKTALDASIARQKQNDRTTCGAETMTIC